MKYYKNIQNIDQLTQDEIQKLKPVTEKFAFCINDYYLSLIDWDDPNDPIKRLSIPSVDEMQEGGSLDPSNESSYTVMPGLEHKYSPTVLLLISNECEGICRFCFRKRLFSNSQQEILQDEQTAFDYITNHPEVNNVLLTGGDPLTLSINKLERIIERLRKIEHVRNIRIGTRMPAYNPHRIIDNQQLLNMLSKHFLPKKRIYIMTHFCHPRELTKAACTAVEKLLHTGVIMTNQCPLIRGINDNSDILAELLQQLSYIGVVPYYLFQCRPALGNHPYAIPIEEGYDIYETAKKRISGLAKRLRFVMSHATGKIEVIAKIDNKIFFKYHEVAQSTDIGRVIMCNSNLDACWLDDYDEIKKTIL